MPVPAAGSPASSLRRNTAPGFHRHFDRHAAAGRRPDDPSPPLSLPVALHRNASPAAPGPQRRRDRLSARAEPEAGPDSFQAHLGAFQMVLADAPQKLT